MPEKEKRLVEELKKGGSLGTELPEKDLESVGGGLEPVQADNCLCMCGSGGGCGGSGSG